MTGENNRKHLILAVRAALILIAAMTGISAEVGTVAAQAKAPCKEMRKIKIGVSVAPPNVATSVKLWRRNHCPSDERTGLDIGLPTREPAGRV